jgi:hypothetical protein
MTVRAFEEDSLLLEGAGCIPAMLASVDKALPGPIKVLVFVSKPPCPCGRCLRAEREALRAAQKFPSDLVLVEKYDAFSIIAKENQISVTPTVVIAGKKVAVGRVLTEDRIAEIIANLLSGEKCELSGPQVHSMPDHR